jgi:aryl-alcohol dehydrogenase-like predicted oxidoreductase
MGRSEEALAKALEGFDRSEYQLSTKFTPQIAGDGEDPVCDALEQSLENLGTDHIDLYWIHNPADVERWAPGLIPLLQAGKVKHVGVSNHDLQENRLADRILGEAGFRVEAVQNHYSLLYRSSEKAGILNHCRENDIRFFPYMVLEQGALTGRYSPENPMPAGTSRATAYNAVLPQLTNRLTAIGAARDASAVDVATAWAIAKGTAPIIGVAKPHYVDGSSALAASSAQLRKSPRSRTWPMRPASTPAADGSTRCSSRRTHATRARPPDPSDGRALSRRAGPGDVGVEVAGQGAQQPRIRLARASRAGTAETNDRVDRPAELTEQPRHRVLDVVAGANGSAQVGEPLAGDRPDE